MIYLSKEEIDDYELEDERILYIIVGYSIEYKSILTFDKKNSEQNDSFNDLLYMSLHVDEDDKIEKYYYEYYPPASIYDNDIIIMG